MNILELLFENYQFWHVHNKTSHLVNHLFGIYVDINAKGMINKLYGVHFME